MKQWLLIFITGLALGGAIGWLAADRGETQADSGAAGSKSGTNGASISGRTDSPSSGGRPRTRGSKSGGRDASRKSPGSRGGFVEYLQNLGHVDDLEEVNFLELVRQSYQITMLSEQEAEAMIDAITASTEKDSGGNDLQQIATALIFARWAELDGPAALRYAVDNQEGSFWNGDVDDMATIAMSTWVEANPSEAIAWFRKQSSAGGAEEFREIVEDNDVQTAFFAALARVDAAQAREMIMGMEGHIDDDAVEAVARREGSEEGLREMLESLSTDDRRARQGVLAEWADRNAAAAAEWLESQPAGEGHHNLVFRVGNEYLNDNLESGTAWLMRQDLPENSRDSRYTMIIDRWAARDLEDAGTWLEQQADDPLRDAAEARLSRHLAAHDHWQSAFNWAAEIGDQQARDRAAKYVFRDAWNDKDKALPEGFLEAAEAAGFGEQTETWIGEHDSN